MAIRVQRIPLFIDLEWCYTFCAWEIVADCTLVLFFQQATTAGHYNFFDFGTEEPEGRTEPAFSCGEAELIQLNN